jgi:flagellar hook-associated protein 2
MAAPLSMDGLISGLDTTALINAIMAVERRSVTLLEARQARVNTQLDAFRTLNTKLLAFQTSAQALAGSTAFRQRAVSVSDETVLTASAANGAAPGAYTVAVQSLARAHQIASQGYADTDTTTLGTGTIQIQIGDGETTSIDVTSANNTLAGLRNAINAADAGATALIVNDGSDAVPYRLLLTAAESGAQNTIAVTVNLTGGTGPNFSSTSIGDLVADDGNTYAGTATSGGTYTGTGNLSYLVEIVQGGDLATATYRISEDGGTTWGSTLSLAGGSIDVYDDVGGTDLGVDATFTDDTFAAGDQFIIDAFVPIVQEAADAEVVIGSGDGRITITSSSNTVSDLLPGVTLSLQKADPAQTVEITVDNDTATVVEQVQAFVDNYNEVVDYIREQTRYDAQSKAAGVLLGNNSALTVQQDLREAVLGTVPGLEAGMNGLYAVGVSVSADGRLSLDTSELESALQSDFDAVARLFKASGESTHAKIQFVAAGSDTVPSVAGYAVQVTQAARSGELVGSTITDPASGPLTIDDTNDELVLAINGTETSTLSLARKTYTSGVELANEIAAKIASSDVPLPAVQVTWVDAGATGHFEIRTRAYGSSASVALGTPPANSAAAILGLTGGVSTVGQDVAGTIDGYAAEGTGRLLKATDTNSDAVGLWLEVALDEAEIGGGVNATVTVIKGAGKQADDLLDYLTDPIDGYVKRKENRYSSQVESYRSQIERKEAVLAKRRERLVRRFARLESAISSLRNQETFLNSQLTSLSSMMTGSR